MTRTPRPDLTVSQVIASALAATTATVAASYLGVTGTVIGAALASVLTVVGNAVYGHSLRRTGDRVRDVVPATSRGRRTVVSAGPAGEPRPVVGRADRDPVPRAPHRFAGPWRRAALGAVAVFAAVLAVVTSLELVTGRPVSTLVRGESGSGTTVFGTSGTGASGTSGPGGTGSPTPSAPASTVTRTVTPSVVITTPTVTRTAPAVTETPTPSPTSTPTATPSPSVTPGAPTASRTTSP